MRDFVGNELKIGDKVVYVDHFRTSSQLVMGIVERFTAKSVFVHGMYGVVRKEPLKVVKYMKD
jgi:hypothetical protein